jgi:adhesin transport system membrane fusion protein
VRSAREPVHGPAPSGTWRPMTGELLGPAPMLTLTHTPRAARLLARMLALGVIALALGLGLVPWQQSVRGDGRVIAYAPLERQQAIEAPVAGRIASWTVQEGDTVVAGQRVVTISDNDPELVTRLRGQRDAIVVRTEATRTALRMMEQQIESLSAVRESAVRSAAAKITATDEALRAAEQDVRAAEAKAATAELNLERVKTLHAEGLASRRDLEVAQLGHDTARAELRQGQAEVAAAKADLRAAKADRSETSASKSASVEKARTELEELRAGLAKHEEDLLALETQLARQATMEVTAPRDGRILRVVAKQGGEQVKQGETLAVIVPDTESRAVELWLDGNDAPLVGEGRHVRLQFEGWPAVQFVGWPSVAVGTFGATVTIVDAAADERGKTRIVVVPDDPSHWPDGRFLRQGTRVHGWVLLDQVPLGFELWRQLNGFPPALLDTEGEGHRAPERAPQEVVR